jgi:DNA repair protein RecO (recombination protein O)
LEWESPGIIVAATAYSEGDALASIFTEAQGVHRGLARGGLSRARAATWQVGNLVEARWVARLAEQLGSFTAELVHPSAALAMDDPVTLAVLCSACAVVDRGLPEREPQPRIFRGLLHLIAHLREGPAGVAALVGWELGLLGELGYGLDLTHCVVSGATTNLAYVSPKTGRAVAAEAAGAWRDRLLPLPAFLLTGAKPRPDELGDALRLTGHFLARDVFGARNLPVPQARTMLQDRFTAPAAEAVARPSPGPVLSF